MAEKDLLSDAKIHFKALTLKSRAGKRDAFEGQMKAYLKSKTKMMTTSWKNSFMLNTVFLYISIFSLCS